MKNGENTLPGELAAYLSGIEYVSKSAAGVPKITLSDSAALEIDALIESISKLGFYTPAEGDAYARDKFTAGKVPFYLGTLSEMLDFYDDFGAFAENRPVLCIPATNTRLEQTSIWLTAFNAASGDWMRDQFLLVSLEKHIRDNNSCLVLNKLLSQKAEFAFERVFAGYYDGLKDATYGAAGKALTGGDKLSAVIAKNITSINKKLAKLP